MDREGGSSLSRRGRRERYGEEGFEERIMAQLGSAGEALTRQVLETSAALSAALGREKFGLLDAYGSARTALSIAREEAIVALCGRRPGRRAAEGSRRKASP